MNKFQAVYLNEDGSPAKLNILNIVVLLAALFEVFQPFIPAEYLAFVVAGLAALNVFANWYSQIYG